MPQNSITFWGLRPHARYVYKNKQSIDRTPRHRRVHQSQLLVLLFERRVPAVPGGRTVAQLPPDQLPPRLVPATHAHPLVRLCQAVSGCTRSANAFTNHCEACLVHSCTTTPPVCGSLYTMGCRPLPCGINLPPYQSTIGERKPRVGARTGPGATRPSAARPGLSWRCSRPGHRDHRP